VTTHRLSPSRKGDWHVLIGPYDADLVADLKRAVPSSGREWMPVSKCWRIAPGYVGIVQGLIDGMVPR
jgi:hypothetical protein